MAQFALGPLDKKNQSVTQHEFNFIADFSKYVEKRKEDGFITMFTDSDNRYGISLGDEDGHHFEDVPVFVGSSNRRTKELFKMISDKSFKFEDIDKSLNIRN